MIRDAATQAARLAAAQRLLDEVLLPNEARTAAEGRIPQEVLAAIRTAGLYGLSLPEEFGGLGLTMEEEAELMLVIGRAAPAYRAHFAINSGASAQMLLRAGTEAQKARWLPGMARGETVAAFALSEAEAGSDAAALSTTARRDGAEWVITGTKRWVTNAQMAGLFVVLARSGEPGARGISAFLVPGGTPGLSIGAELAKLGQRGAPVADVTFADVRLGSDALLGREGEGLRLALAGLDKVRLHLAALCAGLMDRIVAEARAHLLARRQFGKTLAEQPVLAASLADCAAEALAARCMALELARARDAGTLRPADAAAAKLFASEALNRVADRVLQMFGGEGYLDEAPIARLWRDARLFRILDGTSEIQRLVVVRGVFEA